MCFSVALLLAFFINLAVVCTNAANFYSEKCAALPDGPFACLSPEAFNKSNDEGDYVIDLYLYRQRVKTEDLVYRRGGRSYRTGPLRAFLLKRLTNRTTKVHVFLAVQI